MGLSVLVGAVGCGNRNGKNTSRLTELGADRYIDNAVRQSSEGVVLIPSSTTEREYDRVRLNEIAQNLRRPFAFCFLQRAIVTMERGAVEGESTFVNVPDGQIKLRARLGADGTVSRVEPIEAGFDDLEMEACVMKAVTKQEFPPIRGQTGHYIDVVYWVSLGFHGAANSEEFALHIRKEQTRAGVRAKRCLQGRVPPGDYEVEGLSLFDREGNTLVNRVDRNALPPEVSSCVASAFKAIEIPPERDAFVRPVEASAAFTVRDDGVVEVRDERWLELLEMEERARREAARAAIRKSGSGSATRESATTGDTQGDGSASVSGVWIGESEPEPDEVDPEPDVQPEQPKQQPTPGGPLDLRSRDSDSDAD